MLDRRVGLKPLAAIRKRVVGNVLDADDPDAGGTAQEQRRRPEIRDDVRLAAGCGSEAPDQRSGAEEGCRQGDQRHQDQVGEPAVEEGWAARGQGLAGGRGLGGRHNTDFHRWHRFKYGRGWEGMRTNLALVEWRRLRKALSSLCWRRNFVAIFVWG